MPRQRTIALPVRTRRGKVGYPVGPAALAPGAIVCARRRVLPGGNTRPRESIANVLRLLQPVRGQVLAVSPHPRERRYHLDRLCRNLLAEDPLEHGAVDLLDLRHR